jgi:uncharacterized membrane protein YoaK (UPF0700 family)
MERLCHRCGNSLREDEPFCPHCGAPQLLVEASDSSFAQQPAMPLRGQTQGGVHWRAAIVSALLVAIPVGLLSALTRTSFFFVLAGGFATIALYRRRSSATTDGRIGWRVGAILGAASAFLASGAWAAQLVINRYLLHHGASIDALFNAAAQQLATYWMQASAQQGPQPPEVMRAMQNVADFIRSPDGHAAYQLITAVVMWISMVLFAAIGGAIAGRVLAVRRRVQRSL